MNATQGKVKAYGLVRDANGKPKFDDINNIPEPFWNMLTDEEKEEIQNGRDSLSRNA